MVQINFNTYQSEGEVPEWSKGADCKSASTAFEGSNPSLTTTNITTLPNNYGMCGFFFKFSIKYEYKN